MSEPTPWLSVILPVYKVEAYLQACAESILSQADPGVELIFVDDASPDGSAALIEVLQGRHPQQVRLLRHPHNQGLSGARNTGLEAARGDYLWCVDPDDLMEPGALAQLKTLIARDAPDLVLCDFRSFHDDRSVQPARYAHQSSFAGSPNRLQDSRDLLLRGLFIEGQLHAWTKIVRRAAWPAELRFPPGRAFEDLAVYPLLALRVRSYVHVDTVWMAYRQRAGSILDTPSLAKLDDRMSALLGFEPARQAQGLPLERDTQFIIAHYCARTFIRVGKQRLRLRPDGADRAADLRRYGELFAASSPLSPAQLLKEYLRRGRLLRWLQLRHWLRRAGSLPAGT